MLDSFGRKINYVRVSVTDRCDLRCSYCMPKKHKNFIEKKEILSIDKLKFLSKALINVGIKKFRITGGEPLIRTGITEYIKFLGNEKKKKKIEEILLTTNGTQLERFVDLLIQNEVKRLNVSLDSLDYYKYNLITNGGNLNKVLEGVKAASQSGLKIKINTVLLKRVNEDEILSLAEWCGENKFNLSFIEVMPIGELSISRHEQYLSVDFAKHLIDKNFGLINSSYETSGPSKYFKCEKLDSTIGFISPISNHFCSSCNRLRITSDGRIFPCLGDNGSKNLNKYLEEGMESDLESILSKIIFNKPEKHYFDISQKSYIEKRFMNTTGG